MRQGWWDFSSDPALAAISDASRQQSVQWARVFTRTTSPHQCNPGVCPPTEWRLRTVRCRRIFRLADSSLSMRICHRRSLHLMLLTQSRPFFSIRYLLIAVMLCYLSNWLDWPRSLPLICRTSSHCCPPLSAGQRRYLTYFDSLLQGSVSILLASHWPPLEKPREIMDCHPSPWSNNRLFSRSPRHFRSHISSETAALVVIPPHLLSAFESVYRV